MHYIKWLFVFILPLLVSEHTFAQNTHLKLTPAIKAEIVDSVSSMLIKNYVSLDTAVKMSARIKQRLKNGAYNNISDAKDFGYALTLDVYAVYRDLHFGVAYDNSPPKSTMETLALRMRNDKEKNYGVSKTDHLDGNIGYLALNGFYDVTPNSKEVIDGAFACLKNSDALIIDLRKGGGGQPEMVRYICSYFFTRSINIDASYYRRGNTTQQLWTEPLPNSEAFASIPVYILTSGTCFSACEELAYDLQSQRRVTIVGEHTGGGAHGADIIPIKYGFSVYMPYLTNINPVTKTNWEKVGVQPDIKTITDSALVIAMRDIYKHRDKRTNDSLIYMANFKTMVSNAKLHPFKMKPAALKKFTGNYHNRVIGLQNGMLYFIVPNIYKTKMIPLSANVFIVDDNRAVFQKDANGNISAMTLQSADGKMMSYKRDDQIAINNLGR